MSNDVYRLSVSVTGDGWSAQLPNALAAVSPSPQVLAPHQVERTTAYKRNQNREAVEAFLQTVREIAAGTGNLLPPMKEAFLAGEHVTFQLGARARRIAPMPARQAPVSQRSSAPARHGVMRGRCPVSASSAL